MKRVIVIGSTGSGKSTLARKLSERRGLAFIDLDDFHWTPGWKERSAEEFRRLAEEAVQQEKWVVAGNYYSKVIDITWPRADALIWIDLPFMFNFLQLLRRSIRRSISGEMICNGNKETLARQFLSGNSILWWLVKSWDKNRKRYEEVFRSGAHPHLRMIRLRSRAECDRFLEGLK